MLVLETSRSVSPAALSAVLSSILLHTNVSIQQLRRINDYNVTVEFTSCVTALYCLTTEYVQSVGCWVMCRHSTAIALQILDTSGALEAFQLALGFAFALPESTAAAPPTVPPTKGLM